LNLDLLIKKVVDIADIESGNLRYTGNDVNFLNNVEAILNQELIKDSNLLNKFNELRYYSEIFGIPNFFLILKKMKEKTIEPTYFELKNEVIKYVTEIKQKPIIKFELYYLVNINFVDTYKFTVNDVDIEFIIDNTKINSIITNVIEKVPNLIKIPGFKYALIKFTIRARHVNFAEKKCTQLIYYLLGILTLIKYFGSRKITYGGKPKPLSPSQLIYIFVFNNDLYSSYYYFLDHYEIDQITTIENINKDDLFDLNEFIKLISANNNAIELLFIKSLSNYFAGLTEKEIEYSFLKLWTALELIVCLNSSCKFKIIRQRLKTFISDDLEKRWVDRLIDIRNNYVHIGGYTNIAQQDRNKLKLIYEHFFIFIIDQLKQLDPSQIEFILDNADKSDEELLKTIKLINLILKIKEKDKK
jgi:hypothetical protein